MSKIHKKFDTFGKVGTHVLTNFGVKKPVFWTFRKWYWRCSGSVWALILGLKGQLLGVFSAPKVDN